MKTVNKNLGDLSTATVRLKKKKEARSLLEKMQEEQAQLVAAKVQLEKLAFVDKSKVDVAGSKKHTQRSGSVGDKIERDVETGEGLSLNEQFFGL